VKSQNPYLIIEIVGMLLTMVIFYAKWQQWSRERTKVRDFFQIPRQSEDYIKVRDYSVSH